MLKKLSYYRSDSFDPYENLAVEEFLLYRVEPGEMILYLWQNERTVVIGKNQNCWKECKVNYLETDGGFLARRLSGGGAVFHDRGNLNFTFLVRAADYDVDRQLEVILDALRGLGIQGEKSGRNDITVAGRKVSGNAFYQSGAYCYHHGTLLLQVNREDMARYLNVSKAKLNAKGVSSVRSRVANLSDFKAKLSVSTMAEALIISFEKVCGGKTERLEAEMKNMGHEISALKEKYASPVWKYNQRDPFDYEFGGQFSWGGILFQLRVKDGIIHRAGVYSDSLYPEQVEAVQAVLQGCPYQERAICDALSRALKAAAHQAGSGQMEADLRRLICEKL